MCGDEVVTEQSASKTGGLAARVATDGGRYAEQLETTTLGRMWSRPMYSASSRDNAGNRG